MQGPGTELNSPGLVNRHVLKCKNPGVADPVLGTHLNDNVSRGKAAPARQRRQGSQVPVEGGVPPHSPGPPAQQRAQDPGDGPQTVLDNGARRPDVNGQDLHAACAQAFDQP